MLKDNFSVTCGRTTYTNIETFAGDILNNDEALTQEHVQYLEELIWEYIEEGNGKIPEYIVDIITDLIEFIYDFQIDIQLVTWDLYKGWENKLIILQNPKTGNHYGIFKAENRWGDYDYPEGYEFVRVKYLEKVIKEWTVIEE